MNKELVENFNETFDIVNMEFMPDIWHSRANTYILKSITKYDECVVVPNISYEVGTSVSRVHKYAKGSHCAVLNFADGLIKGGLVWDGASTQEESLCRASTLYFALDTHDCDLEYYEYNKQFGYVCSDRVVYSDDVVFFKDDNNNRVEPVKCDVIIAPAPVASSCGVSEYISHVVERMLRYMSFAKSRGVETLILGAWGCGAFGGDLIIMGRCFRRVLDTVGWFKKVVFVALEENTLAKLKLGMDGDDAFDG